MSRLYDGSIITVDGMNFRVSITHDDDMGPPWEECEGHGPVSNWERRSKAPGEMILCEDRGCKRFYDFQETVKIARRDGWGTAGEFRMKGEQANAAALADFEYDWRDTSYVQDEAENMAREIIARIGGMFAPDPSPIEPHEELSDDPDYVIAAEYVSI